MTLEYVLRAAISSMINGRHSPHCYSAWKQGHGYTNDGSVPADRPDYLRQLERDATSEVENMGYAAAYAEPGYEQPKRGVLMANWNNMPRNLDTLLERMGYAIEWSDEWDTCESCNRAIRTSPNSYGWRRSYAILNDCEIVCANCIRDDPADYVETELLNRPDKADTMVLDLASLGFTRFNTDHYENGWHPGQNDNPREIVKHLPPDVDYVFSIPSVGQFDVAFDVWIRPQSQDDQE